MIEVWAIVLIVILYIIPHEAGHILAFKSYGVDTYIDWRMIDDSGRFKRWYVGVVPIDENYMPKTKAEVFVISFAGSVVGYWFFFGCFLVLFFLHMLSLYGVFCLISGTVINFLYGLWEVRVNLKTFNALPLS